MDIGNNIGIAYRDVIIAPPVIVGDFCLTRLAEVDIKIELVEVGTYKVSVTPNGTERNYKEFHHSTKCGGVD